jgi:cyclic phosphodiesterase-like protein
MAKKRITVYWLIPAKPERELFRKIIRILAKEFKAPRFEPHLTFFATSPKDRKATGRILKRLKAIPIRLEIRDISSSAKFTKTLFVRFKSSAALEKLIDSLASQLANPRVKPRPDLHVSLLYKKMKASLKKELASMIKLPFREVVFDSIKAMRCVSPITTRANVKAWRQIGTRRLTH